MQFCKVGPFKSIALPSSWKRQTYRIAGSGRPELPVIAFYPIDTSDTEMSVFFRGRLESEDNGRNFAELLHHHVKSGSTRAALSPGQIKNLTEILDLAGFNQYSFSAEEHGFAPDFNLRSAELVTIDGKAIVSVTGEFCTNQQCDTWYTGCFVDADGSGRKVYEFFLRSTNRESFFKFLKNYNDAVASIEWQDNAKDPSSTGVAAQQTLSSWNT